MNQEENKSQEEIDAMDAVHEDEGSQDEGMQDDDAGIESRDEEMERLRASSESAEKRVLQAQAEAENFRKRMRRDFEDQLRYAAVPLVNDLLQVRDNLHRAIEAAGSTSESDGLREGVAMVAKQLDDTLAKYQIREIPAAGELFDPNYHEAISQIPSDEHAAGTVAHVAVTGFQMHDRVIRPSQVIVSTGPASDTPAN
ncbi:GrpE nucleotide exchange factor [Rhodopirellula maiorica SM1]|uniref:Protein GrpE n=1 Tax=Rhodopirellula maiorica SM1 TaxID=1265738 RepID=M5RV87_9BACT|nr:nucleotide exchange factor GrpE [Rhodopirellula maiorica]EMI19282.1 GrpE nucleotide exchange factor [Rhodopirellula maiorica SM1]